MQWEKPTSCPRGGSASPPVVSVRRCSEKSRALAPEEGTPTLSPRQPASEVERAYLLPWEDASPPAVPVCRCSGKCRVLDREEEVLALPSRQPAGVKETAALLFAAHFLPKSHRPVTVFSQKLGILSAQ